MQPSAQTCRAEEARQRTVSLNAPLANVREVALLAAAAWAKEAIAAERREARAAHARLERASPPLVLRQDERVFSENPDRGFADA